MWHSRVFGLGNLKLCLTRFERCQFWPSVTSLKLFFTRKILFSVFTSPWSKLKIVTIQWIKSRIWDAIDDWYVNNLAKNQVSAVFHSRVISRSIWCRYTRVTRLFSVFTSPWSKLKIITIQWIKSRIWDTIDDWYINNLAKNQVSAVFHFRVICSSVSPKFIELCMETPCLCPSEGHKHGGRNVTETFVAEFCYWNETLLL